MVTVSEGTPGRGPDADSRTDTGDGKAPTNGQPTVPPVRYGPRNASPANGAGRGGSSGRNASGPTSPQQYRAPQPPRTPANGSGSNGSGANGAGSNGSGANGAHAATPSSYTRPRPNATSPRPEPSEQERLVADARIAAAARNASAAKVRGGSALSGKRPTTSEREASPAGETSAAPVDETAVIPVVGPEETAVVTPSDEADATATPTEETAAPEKGRNVLGRLRGRDRRTPKDTQVAPTAAVVTEPAADPAVTTPTDEAETAPTAKSAEPESGPGSEPSSTPETTSEPDATEDRPLTWRDRLGLRPKEPKPQPVDVPETGPGIPTAAAAAAVAASVAAGSAPPETLASPTGPTSAPQPALLRGRVTPSAPIPSTGPDTVVIPAVDAGAVSPAAPAAAATAQPLVTAKPKVGAARRTRKARLRLSRVDPWSVMKTALLFSIAAGIILVVATYGVWSVLNASGLFDAVNDMVKSVVSTPGDTTPFRIEEYVNTQKIIGVAALIAVVDVLIFTALATLGSFLYNLAATVLGGLEVTLAED